MMSPNQINVSDREMLANVISGWLEQQMLSTHLSIGENVKGRFYEINIGHNNAIFATLVIDHYDDTFIHQTQETFDYFDPEYFKKLLNSIRLLETKHETQIRRPKEC